MSEREKGHARTHARNCTQYISHSQPSHRYRDIDRHNVNELSLVSSLPAPKPTNYNFVFSFQLSMIAFELVVVVVVCFALGVASTAVVKVSPSVVPRTMTPVTISWSGVEFPERTDTIDLVIEGSAFPMGQLWVNSTDTVSCAYRRTCNQQILGF